MTPVFVPQASRLSPLKRMLLGAMGPFGFALRALPGRFGVAARWDDVHDVLEDEAAFATPYAGVEEEVLGGAGLFPLGLSGAAQRDARARLEAALDFGRAAPMLAQVARARITAGRAALGSGDGPIDYVGLANAAAMAALRPWLGLRGGAVMDAQLGQWAMTLFEWQFAGVSDAALPATQATARAMRAFVDDRIASAQADGGEGLIKALLAARVPDGQARAWVVGIAVAALPQLPIAAVRALNQLLARPAVQGDAQRALERDREKALWPFIQEALRLDPVAPALQRVVRAPPVAGRFGALRPEAPVRVLLKAAMRDGRRVARPGAFDPHRDSSAWLGFGAGPHACLAQGLARAMLPAMLSPVLKRSGMARAGRMHAPGLAPTRFELRFDP